MKLVRRGAFFEYSEKPFGAISRIFQFRVHWCDWRYVYIPFQKRYGRLKYVINTEKNRDQTRVEFPPKMCTSLLCIIKVLRLKYTYGGIFYFGFGSSDGFTFKKSSSGFYYEYTRVNWLLDLDIVN